MSQMPMQGGGMPGQGAPNGNGNQNAVMSQMQQMAAGAAAASQQQQYHAAQQQQQQVAAQQQQAVAQQQQQQQQQPVNKTQLQHMPIRAYLDQTVVPLLLDGAWKTMV
jgi:hypothetical protein